MARSDSGVAGLVPWARTTARRQLASLGRRLAHVEAVGRRAELIATRLEHDDPAHLIAAAYLHDVGYAHGVRVTGLHQLDGARWLRQQGVNARVYNLVAHHSEARFEAQERGLLAELDEFDMEDGPAMDALVFADMTTAGDGTYVTFAERLDDILRRYPPGDPVHAAMLRAAPYLRGSVVRTLERLGAEGQPMYGLDRSSR